MKTSMKAKLAVDAGMTVSLLLLMAYGLVGEKAHEWLGIGMFVLFVLHHILNRKWFGTAVKRNHSTSGIMKSALVVLIFLCMIGLAVSGIALSRYVFSSLPKHGGQEIFEKIHMLCAYWGFVLMSFHLGLHWNMMLAAARKQIKPGKKVSLILKIIGYLFSLYGVIAFVRRDIGLYLFLKSHFVFFDYTEPLIFFLFDYLAVMGLFVLLGYSVSKLIKVAKPRR
ncbi:MAG: DUF4405 domain-containing protein [Clostridia bacterium]|nr:DUF4405 domain-containing protein [Clostridia bacterium]